MTNILEMPVKELKGVGPKTIQLLSELNIYTLKDILFNIPNKINSTQSLSKEIDNGEKVVTKGIIINKVTTQFYNKRKTRSYFLLKNELGIIKVVFFNQLYLKKLINEGVEVVVKGTYTSASNIITASNISFDLEENIDSNKIEIIYSLKKGINQKKYSEIVKQAYLILENNKEFIDLVPKNFKGIWDLKKILHTLHFPKNIVSFDKAKKMFAFHELLEYQLKIQLQSLATSIPNKNYSVNIDNSIVDFFKNSLNFKLTNSQNKVIDEIILDLKSPYKMDRLLQGDVGCGKTVVAAAIIYYVVNAGYQCALMSPTEILSKQHFDTFFNFFKDLDISIALLTSSTSKKEREKIISLLKEGEIDLLIGTHSLIQEDVIFKNLKLSITDEQHRFGVNQRKNLGDKGDYVHTLMMTATPIPRSLAISLITNIKVSTIDELPSGRKKVNTYKATNKEFENVINNIIIELEKGRQGYIVCPLIEESEKIDLQNVIQLYDSVVDFIPSEYKVEFLHGKMTVKEKNDIMERYINKEIHILISTTVIEVGVNVPNATFMIIVDAHRFGLATLHQLRGRVGRSNYESLCILVTDSKSERIDVMCLEYDGFKISEFDLKNRGPGDFFGTKQSGLPNFKVADLLNDTELMYLAKKLAYRLIEVTDNKDKLKNYLGISNEIIN